MAQPVIPFNDSDIDLITGWLHGAPPPHTGAQHIPCETETDWLAAREEGLGASEIGVVMGVSHWASPYALYWRKKMRWQIPSTEAQRWGHLVEDPIAVLFAEEMRDRLYVAKPVGHPYSLWAHPHVSWAICTPDRLGVTPDGVIVPVELKSDEGGTGWGVPETDEVPPQYRCQAQWQAAIFDAPGTYVVRKRASGRKRMVWYWVPYDGDYALEMFVSGTQFLDAIALGNPPDPDGSDSTTAVLQDLYPVQPEAFANIDAGLWEEWSAARAQKRESAAHEKYLSNLVRAALGGAEFGTVTTDDGLEVVRVKRRIGKRSGYAVPAGTVDELREIGGQRATGAPVPGSNDPQTPEAAAEEGASGGGVSGGGMGDNDRRGADGEGIGEDQEVAPGVDDDMQEFLGRLPLGISALIHNALENGEPLIRRDRQTPP